jgi:ABC transporter, phosphonate, periplasmic substrate-binding protein
MGGWERQVTRRRCLSLMAGAASDFLRPRFGLADKAPRILTAAISTDTLAGANVNDARAAYKVWIREVTRQLPSAIAQMDPEIFISSEEMIRSIRQGSIECFGITALEFVKVADLVDPDYLVLQDYLADGLEYVLLVHDKSPIKKIADLRGAQLLTHFHRDMVLAPAWLGTLLAGNSLPGAERFFGAQKLTDNLNQVLLPVFFRRADAACISKRNWETTIELNPQLGRDLRAVAISPKLVPLGIAFRRGCSAEGRRTLIESILKVSSLTGGQQIISLYQARDFVVRPTSVMNRTLEMVRQFERVSSGASKRK